RLMHEPTEGVSFGGLPFGASLGDAPDLVAGGPEVARAGSGRAPQLGWRVGRPVVGRPPPELLPGPPDRVRLRAAARQPLELRVRAVPQRPADRPPGAAGRCRSPAPRAGASRAGTPGRRAAGG